LGWSTTIAYLILPLLLVASQFASMQLMQPPKTEETAEQAPANAILKFLPLMIGWFSLNVPSALCIYWITNNVVTTASTVFIRNNVAAAAAIAGPAATTSAPSDTSSAKTTGAFSPPREKPSGFGASKSTSSDGVNPITSIDAEIEEPLVYDNDNDDEDAATSSATKQKRGKKSKKGKN
jgi:YidC/Oxa1 family membrane protein insertase